MHDMTQAQADWTRLEHAAEAVRLATLALARATYAHNLTRGCDPLSAYRVTSRDLPEAITSAADAALLSIQQEVAAARRPATTPGPSPDMLHDLARERTAYAAQGISN